MLVINGAYPAPGNCSRMPVMVGISAGITTPVVELNQLITPDARAMMGLTVEPLMMEVRPSTRRSMPPRALTTAISMFTPQTRMKVPQGMILMAALSLATPKMHRMMAARGAARPMLTPKANTTTTTARQARRVIFWFRSKGRTSSSMASCSVPGL